MSTIGLSALAAALRGGLQGYKDANAMQRQSALDELQRKKIEEDDALKRAALVHKSDYDANRLRLEAEAATAKAQGAQLAEEDRLRKYHASGWGVGNDPEFADLRGPYMALGDDYAKAPPGPKPVIDQYGVIDGANEWNQFDKPTRGQIEAQGDLILRDVAKRQAEINARKHSQEMEKIKVKAEAPPKPPKQENIKPGYTAKDLTDFKNQMGNLKGIYDLANRTASANLGKFNSLLDDVSTFTNSMDPDVAELRQALQKNLAEYMKMISGAAVSDPEVQRLAQVQPTPKDSLRVLLRKTAALGQAMARAYGNAHETLRQTNVNVGSLPQSLDASWADKDWGPGGPAGPAAELSKPPGAGPGFKPVQRKVEGF